MNRTPINLFSVCSKCYTGLGRVMVFCVAFLTIALTWTKGMASISTQGKGMAQGTTIGPKAWPKAKRSDHMHNNDHYE